MADDRPAPAGIAPPRAARDAGDPACPVRRAPDGSWQLSGHDDVRALLRSISGCATLGNWLISFARPAQISLFRSALWSAT